MINRKLFFAGLDLGGTFLKYAIGNQNGTVIYKGKRPSRADQSQQEVFKVMFEAVHELLGVADKHKGVLAAIGVGSPGAIDFENGRLIGSTPNIQHWENADIRAQLEAEFSIPVWADNDANIMAFAEARHGAAEGHKNVICATLGTGIGGGILIDGELYRGKNYTAGEIGHLMIVHDGLPCNCGGKGCFEQYASAPAMVRHYAEILEANGKKLPKDASTVTIFANAAAGEKEAQQAIDMTVDYLGTGFASLTNIFNPEIIVIGGGVAEAGDEFIAKIRENVFSKAMKPTLKDLKIVRATLGNDAGFIGAIILAAEMYFKSKKRFYRFKIF